MNAGGISGMLEPVPAAPYLESTRDVGFQRLMRLGLHHGTTTCPLRPRADSVKTARDVTRTTLSGWGLPELRDDAALVVSELVTNAVRYGICSPRPVEDHTITLILLHLAPHVLLAVSDPSDEIPFIKKPDCVSEHGRGLHIVETYSTCWGWDALEEGGKAVWALFGSGI